MADAGKAARELCGLTRIPKPLFAFVFRSKSLNEIPTQYLHLSEGKNNLGNGRQGVQGRKRR
jgi:hypothetical protein